MLGAVVRNGERARKDTSLQAVARIVDRRNGFLDRVVRDDAEYRRKRLLRDHLHRGGNICEYGRLVECTRPISAREDTRSLILCLIHPLLDALCLALGDHGADLRVHVHEITAAEIPRSLRRCPTELLIDAARYVDTLTGDADLPRIHKRMARAVLGDPCDVIHILVHDVCGVRAKLQGDTAKANRLVECLADRNAAREREHPNALIGGE